MQEKLIQVAPLARIQLYLLNHYHSQEQEPWCYHTQFSYHLQIGKLSLPLFFKAVKSVLDRHPVLKTVMLFAEGKEVRQALNPSLTLPVGFEDISALTPTEQGAWLNQFLLQDRNRPFAVQDQQEPLVRAYLIRRGRENVQLVLAIHHAIWDGWSLAVLLKEIFAHYQALLQKPTLSLAPAPYDYSAFVADEQRARQSGEAKAFWRQHLRHHQPFMPPRQRQSQDYNAYQPALRQLPAALLPKLAAVQKSLRVTMKALFAAAFLRVVQAETLQQHTTIGLVTNGRHVNLSNPLTTLGLLWNLAPLCVEEMGDELSHLKQVNSMLAEVSPYGSYPLLDILASQSAPELFHASFNFINFEGANLLPAGSQVEFLEVGGLDKFHTPLHLLVGKNPFNKNISLVLNYDTRYYSESQIEEKLEDYLLRLELLCHLIPEPQVIASKR